MEKYTGRTIEELMNVKVSDMTGAELKHLEEHKKNGKQSSIMNFAIGTKERVMNNITDFAKKTARIGADARARAEKEAEVEDVLEEARKALRKEYGLDEEEN